MYIDTRSLAKFISRDLKLTYERSLNIVNAISSSILNATNQQKEVYIRNFGKFVPQAHNSGAAILSSEVSAKIMEPRQNVVESIINKLVEIIQKQLFLGKLVSIDNVGDLELKVFRPMIQKGESGYSLVKRGSFLLNFYPDPGARLTFKVDNSFLEKFKIYNDLSSIFIVVKEIDFFYETIIYRLKKAGWSVHVLDVDACLEKLASNMAYLIIVDARISDCQRLCNTIKSDPALGQTTLLLIFPNQKSLYEPENFIIIGDSNIFEPFELTYFLKTLDDIILKTYESEFGKAHSIWFHLPTDEKIVEQLIDKASSLLEESGINDECQVSLLTAFREGIANAAQHGNLFKREKRLEVQYFVDREKVKLTVIDMGQGFDYNFYIEACRTGDPIAAARARFKQGRVGGLGIMLMLRCTDELKYFGNGNHVTLTKHITNKKLEPAATPV